MIQLIMFDIPYYDDDPKQLFLFFFFLKHILTSF